VVLGLILGLPVMQGMGLLLVLAILLAVSLFTGWLIYAASRWVSRSDASLAASYRRPILAALASTVLVVAGGSLVTIWLLNRYLGPWVGPLGLDLGYPPLWGALSLAALAGTLVTYPLRLWLIRRDVIRWGGAPGSTTARTVAG
jgi:hypothetical protein